MTCRGICQRHHFIKDGRVSLYTVGGKRCQHCNIFVDMPGLYCLCCGYKLRTKRRNKSSKLRREENEKRYAMLQVQR